MNTRNNLMIIDDDISLLKSVEQILTDAGYTVSISKSGMQAVRAIQQGVSPDLILLDVAMPEMDGYATFNALREHTKAPIIFLTGIDSMESELKGLQLGAVDYITKPFVKDILLARIKNHLNNIDLYKFEAPKSDDVAAEYDPHKLAEMSELLTDTEFNVAKLIANGYTNQEIAEQLSFSYSYVKKIAYRIFDKLDVNKRNEIRDFFMK